HLRGIALLPRDAAPWRAPPAWQPADTALPLPVNEPPLFRVDTALRPEALLHRRDRLRETEPAAIVVAAADGTAVTAALRTPANAVPCVDFDPIVLPLAAVLMIASWYRPRARAVRAVAQAAVAVALPLWLVVGLRIGDDLSRSAQIAIGLTALHVAVLARSDTAQRWRWFGGWRALIHAAAAPLLSLLIVLALGRPNGQAAVAPAAAAGYLLWALLQQYLIGAVFADRLRLAGLPLHWTVLAAATLFALLHAPNAALMLATFAGGLLWSTAWLQERSLLPQAVSHVAAALVLTSGLPPDWLRSAEVSLRFFL
uniref:CPBP family glutamic-type intramembrane protease n=1 Tax=Tahibacter caeni TaxID=1453545 RepID=UPI0021479A40